MRAGVRGDAQLKIDLMEAVDGQVPAGVATRFRADQHDF
jgi:hypothetical protein